MFNPLDFSNRTILVTGASSGIGRATAILLSRLGARVVLVGRNPQRLAATVTQLAGSGHCVEACDLRDYEQIPAWTKEWVTRSGPLDGLVHSAGVQDATPVKALTRAPVESMWQLNVAAALWLAKGFRQRGVNREGGSIVLVASVMGLVGQPARAAYSATKGAVVALTKSLALELAREQIRVNCVAPGYVRTEMTEALTATLTPEQIAAIAAQHPLGIGEPEDVAQAAAYLLSAAARWVTGTTLVVDGGYTAH